MEGRPHTVAIIQSRMTSTRLPGKVLKPLLGEPMLCWVVERLKRARTLDNIVIATTTDPDDDAIVAQCQLHNYPCYRGSRDDVLDRYYQAATEFQAETIVRITSDCPLIDPTLVDEVVDLYHNARPECDYASNALNRYHYPPGLDVEVFSYDVLRFVLSHATESESREHVTAFIYQNPAKFKLCSLTPDQDNSDLRWTVDTAEDFELVTKIAEHFGNKEFTWRAAIAYCRANPSLLEINRHIQQKRLQSEE